MDDRAKVPTSFRLAHDVAERIVTESNHRDMAQTEFVSEALREKFERIDNGADTGWGPLTGMDEVDRSRVERFIECLRMAPRDRGFRRAVDANFAWLVETCQRGLQSRK